MYEQYEFMRALYIEKEKGKNQWEILVSGEKKILEVAKDKETFSPRLDFLNLMGKEGWHYACKSGDYEYLQRKKVSIMELD